MVQYMADISSGFRFISRKHFLTVSRSDSNSSAHEDGHEAAADQQGENKPFLNQTAGPQVDGTGVRTQWIF